MAPPRRNEWDEEPVVEIPAACSAVRNNLSNLDEDIGSSPWLVRNKNSRTSGFGLFSANFADSARDGHSQISLGKIGT